MDAHTGGHVGAQVDKWVSAQLGWWPIEQVHSWVGEGWVDTQVTSQIRRPTTNFIVYLGGKTPSHDTLKFNFSESDRKTQTCSQASFLINYFKVRVVEFSKIRSWTSCH